MDRQVPNCAKEDKLCHSFMARICQLYDISILQRPEVEFLNLDISGERGGLNLRSMAGIRTQLSVVRTT